MDGHVVENLVSLRPGEQLRTDTVRRFVSGFLPFFKPRFSVVQGHDDRFFFTEGQEWRPWLHLLSRLKGQLKSVWDREHHDTVLWPLHWSNHWQLLVFSLVDRTVSVKCSLGK